MADKCPISITEPNLQALVIMSRMELKVTVSPCLTLVIVDRGTMAVECLVGSQLNKHYEGDW